MLTLSPVQAATAVLFTQTEICSILEFRPIRRFSSCCGHSLSTARMTQSGLKGWGMGLPTPMRDSYPSSSWVFPIREEGDKLT
jgi:hypothetical protein